MKYQQKRFSVGGPTENSKQYEAEHERIFGPKRCRCEHHDPDRVRLTPLGPGEALACGVCGGVVRAVRP